MQGAHDLSPATVRYNDWREIEVAPAEAFTPARPVSVIVPYHEAPRALRLLLAALEGQTYPRDLFEVVVVDDGSRIPLERPRSTPLDVKVVRQEDRGFGAARARNTGARAAAHDILLFLDGDMLPEADWLVAHARWHHAAGDLLTLGSRAHVAVDGVDAQAIRQRPGTLRELFADRPAEPESWVERHLDRTRELTSRDAAAFMVVGSSNFGIARAFFELIGGFDESFTRWGLEDTELGWRAWVRGGVVVPVRSAFAWHQGRWAEGRERKQRSKRRQMAMAVHLIADEAFRGTRPGCVFTVPRFVVTLEVAESATERIAETVETVLADPASDLVVWIELPEDDTRRGWLQDRFGPDPRVRVGVAEAALEALPAAPFHVMLPAAVRFEPGVVQRLRAVLGDAVSATATLPDGARVSMVRAWALHRARRTGRCAADFGEAVVVPARRLRIALSPDVLGKRGAPGRFPDEAWRVRGLGQARWFPARLAAGALRRLGLRRPIREGPRT